MIVKIRNTLFGAGLWAVALGASALSLGAGRGSVVLGSPVDLSFDVEPDPGVELSASCISAALTAGSTPIGDARVRVLPLPDVRGRSPGVRVQASITLDEPVLTVVLSAGCTGRVSRTYTFLADFPVAAPARVPVDIARLPGAAALPGSAAAAAAVPLGSAEAPRSAAPAPAAAASGRPGREANAPVPPRAAASAAPAVRKPANAANAAAPRPAARATPRPAEPARPRLVMEPLDVWIDTPLNLRASPELAATPADAASPERERAQAAWKALNTPLEVQIDQDRRLAALEAEARNLKTRLSAEQGNAQARQQELADALDARFPAEWVYGLAALSALLAGLAGWLYARQRKAEDGWTQSVARTTMGRSGAEQELDLSSSVPASVPASIEPWTQPHTLPVQTSAPAPAAPGPAAAPPAAPVPSPSASFGASVAAPTVMPPLATPVQPAAPMQAPAVAAASPQAGTYERAAGIPSVMHLLNAEDLFDIQQQAEFFISVGEHGHAVEILRGHIDSHGTSSPLAYLELLGLYHMLGRADDFNALRAEFSEHFNVRVPEFAAFHRPGKTLEQYPDELAAIEAEWSTDAVLDRLEEYVSRTVGGRNAKLFDMAAFDDLLLLIAIAQTTPASARGAPPPRTRTTPQAQSFEQAAAVAMAAVAPLADEESAQLPLDPLNSGIEFDFTAVSAPAPAEPKSASVQDDSGFALDLDLDLSEPPSLALGDLPAVPPTAPPAPGQPVGFGSNSDLLEVRLELEPRNGDKPRG